jgi:hypothetical protein
VGGTRRGAEKKRAADRWAPGQRRVTDTQDRQERAAHSGLGIAVALVCRPMATTG